MNRRSFLSGLLGAAAALAVDPEKLIWTPTKTIFIPPATKIVPAFSLPEGFHVGDVITFGGTYARHPRTQAVLPYLQQFLVTSESGDLYPAAIHEGMYANVSRKPRGEGRFFWPHGPVVGIH